MSRVASVADAIRLLVESEELIRQAVDKQKVAQQLLRSIAANEVQPISGYVVQTLQQGNLSAPAYVVEDDIQKFLRKSWDVLVYEPQDAIQVGRKRIVLSGQPGMQRGMLWLCLTKVGTNIYESDIKSVCDFGGSTDIYQYRAQLAKLLGTALRNRVISRKQGTAYSVPSKTWSFCWIRTNRSPVSSDLLRGLVKFKDEQGPFGVLLESRSGRIQIP